MHIIPDVWVVSVLILSFNSQTGSAIYPIVVATWSFSYNATASAWDHMNSGFGAVDSVVHGCGYCEENMNCGNSVGYGAKPSENGETTLDAMIMDGETLAAGGVGCLRSTKNAIGVAHAVMKYTSHTLLVGNLADDFAAKMGFPRSNLSTDSSIQTWDNWKTGNCQPNFWKNVSPDPTQNCGPYLPASTIDKAPETRVPRSKRSLSTEVEHDTIGMVAIDPSGSIASGTSTNGLTFKVAGRVGDSPIVGAGSYADNEAGAAAATGNGDIMMRFLPSFHAVELMRNGYSPSDAALAVITKMERFYPASGGALIAINTLGEIGVACFGYYSTFEYTVMSPDYSEVQLFVQNCIPPSSLKRTSRNQ